MTDGTPRLRIAALLPPPLQVRLLSAVEWLPATIVCLLSETHSLSLLHDPISLIIVDPMGDRAMWRTGVSALLRRKPVMPVIAYTALTRASTGVLAALAREGLRELVLTPYEDSPERFARTLLRIATSAHDVSA